MHILFLDESGTPPKPGQSHPRRFVVGGLIIPEGVWHAVRDGLHGLKVRYGVRGELKWRFFAPANDDLKNPLRQKTPIERNAIRADIYRLISTHKGITTVACVVSAAAAYKLPATTCQADLYALAYKGVTERFQYYLQDLSKTTGRKEYGIIVCDQRGPADDRALRGEHQKLVYSSGQNISNYKNLIETLFLSPSHLSIGIQLADMVAGAVWRRYERDDDEWYNFVEPTLRRSKEGKVDGFGIVKMPKIGWE